MTTHIDVEDVDSVPFCLPMAGIWLRTIRSTSPPPSTCVLRGGCCLLADVTRRRQASRLTRGSRRRTDHGNRPAHCNPGDPATTRRKAMTDQLALFADPVETARAEREPVVTERLAMLDGNDERNTMTNFVVCGGCGSRWTGLSVCHAKCCHRTFSSLSGFDQHRVGAQCCDPKTRGLVPISRLHWSGFGRAGDDERWGDE
jgi:hypothetical protein